MGAPLFGIEEWLCEVVFGLKMFEVNNLFHDVGRCCFVGVEIFCLLRC